MTDLPQNDHKLLQESNSTVRQPSIVSYI